MSNQQEPATRVLCEAEKEETKVSGAWVLLAEWAAGDLSCEFALQAQTLETRFRFKSRPASVLEQAWREA